jgi:hypothetical protein
MTSTGGPRGDVRASASERSGGDAAFSALDALVAFAERSPATKADIDQVMRSLADHDGWYVPVSFADRSWGQTEFDQRLPFPDGPPTRVLNVFTDEPSARMAEGHEIGPYGGPVPGTRLMRALGPDYESLMVNYASPREHQWYVSAAAFDIAMTWGTTIAAERALARRGSGPVPTAELLAHRFHLLLERRSQDVAQIRLPDIDGAVAVCFTAEDRAEEFMSSLPPSARPLADLSLVPGPRLFEVVFGVGAAGLVVNAGSDDQTALTGEDLDQIASVPVTP